MSLWIKICANTSLHDAMLAVEAGADAVGFVFAPSTRQVTVEQVAGIVPHLPAAVEKIGVFAAALPEAIADAAFACGLTGVQLHFEAPAGLTAVLRKRLGPAKRIVRTVHFGIAAAGQAAVIDLDPSVDAVLVDSRTKTATGGTGIAFDWDEARRTLFVHATGEKPRIAAGGLGPANVAEAIAKLQPWGVDVASGVEAAPGRKDPARVRAFVEGARAASRLLVH